MTCIPPPLPGEELAPKRSQNFQPQGDSPGHTLCSKPLGNVDSNNQVAPAHIQTHLPATPSWSLAGFSRHILPEQTKLRHLDARSHLAPRAEPRSFPEAERTISGRSDSPRDQADTGSQERKSNGGTSRASWLGSNLGAWQVSGGHPPGKPPLVCELKTPTLLERDLTPEISQLQRNSLFQRSLQAQRTAAAAGGDDASGEQTSKRGRID